jgi:uncharacterized protein YkwD
MIRTLSRVALLAALAVAGTACMPSGAMEQELSGSPASAPVEVGPSQAANAISSFRAENGLPPVTVNATLVDAAEFQADEMARQDRLSHTVSGDLTRRMGRVGYQWRAVAENIAAGQRNLQEAMDGWIMSPAHRENLLNPMVTEIGIATAFNPNSQYRVYWALILAAPRE